VSDLKQLLPVHKKDCERAEAIVTLGFPAVAPVLPELVEWLKDINWPVAHVIAPFLATIGMPLVPSLRRVLGGNDPIWKYRVLHSVVAESRPLAAALRNDLRRLATAPGADDVEEEVGKVAEQILVGLVR
jgi:hypothetical protein